MSRKLPTPPPRYSIKPDPPPAPPRSTMPAPPSTPGHWHWFDKTRKHCLICRDKEQRLKEMTQHKEKE
ncbi:hypothetical protein LCGC14_1205550 [marine sediment metagenome]|uniref:Uncharacterized protein n=1 Tax=marine sediment metagenome TaxID=412755 RepID=A0A0F9LFG7_9ZZZZ